MNPDAVEDELIDASAITSDVDAIVIQSVNLAVLSAANAAASAHRRPRAGDFWAVYLNYDDYNQGEVWDKVGPQLGTAYRNANSCAARVCYGLNYGGDAIPSKPEYQTNLNQSDSKRYIISARQLRAYLNWRWGSPDYRWPSIEIRTIADLRAKLHGRQVAVAAWEGHCAVVSLDYADTFTPYAGEGDIWILRS